MMAGRPFFNIAGIGFDARVAKEFNNRAAGRRGAWPYLVLGVREGWRYGAVDYRLQLDDDPCTVRALLIAFANGREYGLGARIAPGAELDDGWLDATIVEERSTLARFWHARRLVMGTAHLAPRVRTARIASASVEADGPMEFHVDGEPGVAQDRIEIRVVPAALKVRTARFLQEHRDEHDEFFEAARTGMSRRCAGSCQPDPALITTTRAAGETPLMTALYNKQQRAADWLVQSGAPLDIFAAAAVGDIATIERLLQPPAAGLHAYRYDGWTLLHLAAFFGQRAAVERLMAAGADINAVSRNALRNTPLHAAVAGGHVEVSLLLINAAADVNVPMPAVTPRSTLPPKRVTFPWRGHCSSAAPTRTPSMPRTAPVIACRGEGTHRYCRIS